MNISLQELPLGAANVNMAPLRTKVVAYVASASGTFTMCMQKISHPALSPCACRKSATLMQLRPSVPLGERWRRAAGQSQCKLEP